MASQVTPYDEIIGDSDPKAIQQRYEQHRQKRNAAQRERLLSGELTALDIDQTLYKLVNQDTYPGYADERHCLVFWGRPTQAIKNLISEVQQRLKRQAPSLWLMPQENLHITVMEMAHSLTQSDMNARLDQVRSMTVEITDYTYSHRARLLKPMIGYDASALALSFVPAAGEGGTEHDDAYSYHHLRRDIWELCRSTGVEVASRYVLPSAHLTIGRFVTNDDHSIEGKEGLDHGKVEAWLQAIDDINSWLKETYWPKQDGTIPANGEWVAGQEKGLSFQAGTIWYGSPDSGETSQSVRLGKGF